MIIYCEVEVEELLKQGKGYKWPKPPECPACARKELWGHGYVRRYFEGYQEELLVRRYYCAGCKKSHTMRPRGYWRRFQTLWRVIQESLLYKAENGRWLRCMSRQRQQYWWKGLHKQFSRFRTVIGSALSGYIGGMSGQIILSSHSAEYYETKVIWDGPYSCFAVTPPCVFG